VTMSGEALHGRAGDRTEKGYRSVLETPERALPFFLAGALGVLCLLVVLLIAGPSQTFWEVFDHAAGSIAVAGLLLAVPALIFAWSTDQRLRRFVEISEVRNLKATLRETVAEPESSPPVPADEIVGQVENSESAIALAGAIRAGADTEGIAALLRGTDVLALGESAGEMSAQGQSTESDLLHFEVEHEGTRRVMLPIFTRAEALRDAVLRNPDWQSLSILQVNGGSLLENRDPDVTLVLNPWSSLEFQIPPIP